MILKKSILKKVNNPQCRTRIALVLGVGEQTVYVHMRDNMPDNRLTKYDALKAISKEAEVGIEEILEDEKEVKLKEKRA
jgi:hypothetical protein